MAPPRGSWMGSMATDAGIERLRRARPIPVEELVICRAPPEDEIKP